MTALSVDTTRPAVMIFRHRSSSTIRVRYADSAQAQAMAQCPDWLHIGDADPLRWMEDSYNMVQKKRKLLSVLSRASSRSLRTQLERQTEQATLAVTLQAAAGLSMVSLDA